MFEFHTIKNLSSIQTHNSLAKFVCFSDEAIDDRAAKCSEPRLDLSLVTLTTGAHPGSGPVILLSNNPYKALAHISDTPT